MTRAHARTSDARSEAPSDPQRRRLLAGGTTLLGAAGLGGVAMFAQSPTALATDEQPKYFGRSRNRHVLRNAGAGIHAGPDTALGVSTFTLNPLSITCGVGSLANSPGAVPGTTAVPTGAASSGPFIMMMYAVRVDRYDVSKSSRRITATGVMRSITNAATQLIEDVEHPFVAEGIDHRNRRPDEFYLHFVTPFWTPSTNPMATKSFFREDFAMFGSPILMGEINVG